VRCVATRASRASCGFLSFSIILQNFSDHTWSQYYDKERLLCIGKNTEAKVVQRTVRHLLENDLEAKIAQTTPQDALDLLTSIKGIGRWTVHVALCDWLADWSYYPFEDLTVRTWAGKLWHGVQWPQDDRQFAALWQEINGGHTGIITFYLLSCAATRQVPQPYVQEVLF
jgi:3-methyladenine DNA glycosylase/8-oxoguanine DNA glycosylase